MVDAYNLVGGNLIAAMNVAKEDVSKYGILKPAGSNGKLVNVSKLVEKPSPEEAPSTLAISGRYILQPEIFEYLALEKTGAGGEIQLTDSIEKLLQIRKYLVISLRESALTAAISSDGFEQILPSHLRMIPSIPK